MPLLKKLAICLLVAALFQACNLMPLTEGVTKNDQIPTSERNDFHRKTQEFFTAIKTQDFDAVESMLSGELLDNNANKRTRELIGNHLKMENYSLYNEYFIVDNKPVNDSQPAGPGKYGIKYQPKTKESYIAFYLPKESHNQHMITLVYAKLDYGWKIDKIEFEPYTHNGKTSAQLYELAKKQYAKGYIVDALNSMTSALDCASPSEELILPYDNDMRAFHNELIAKANEKYKFMMVMNEVSGHPAIFRVYTRDLNDGTYPVVSYLTSVSIKDTTAIKKQNNEVKKVIGKMIPGIDKDKKYLIYYIYNEKPNAISNSYSYTIIDKLQ